MKYSINTLAALVVSGLLIFGAPEANAGVLIDSSNSVDLNFDFSSEPNLPYDQYVLFLTISSPNPSTVGVFLELYDDPGTFLQSLQVSLPGSGLFVLGVPKLSAGELLDGVGFLRLSSGFPGHSFTLDSATVRASRDGFPSVEQVINITDPLSVVEVSFTTVVTESFGPFASIFSPGDVANISYELDTNVLDSNASPDAGVYFDATLSLTFEFPGLGLTIDFTQGNVQTFDNTANPDDQVFIFGNVNQNGSTLGGESILLTELDYTGTTSMLSSDAQPTSILSDITRITSFFETSSGFTQVDFSPQESNGPQLVVDQGKLVGIQGLEVGSNTFDVAFLDGSFDDLFTAAGIVPAFIGNEPGATAAASAIIQVLMSDGRFINSPQSIGGCSSVEFCIIAITFDGPFSTGIPANPFGVEVQNAFINSSGPGSVFSQFLATNITFGGEVTFPVFTSTGSTPGAEPPTAEAGPNVSIHAGQQVALNGDGSFDDLTPTEDLLYFWSFVSVPEGSSLTALNGASTILPTFTSDLPGEYVVSLVVTDQNGLSSAPDTVTVSSQNVPPTADAGFDLGAIVGDFLTLDGSASNDADFDAITYSWTLTGVPSGSTAALTFPNSPFSHLIPDLPGIYTAQLIVNDGFTDSTPDEAIITVVTAEAFAEVKVIQAINGVGALAPSSVRTKGNQTALSQYLSQVIVALQSGDIEVARKKLIQAIERTDGCALRGVPDSEIGQGPQPKKDYITDCLSQELVYELLMDALAVLLPFPIQSATLQFEADTVNLETGEVCADIFLRPACNNFSDRGPQAPNDLNFAFNGGKTNPAVLFQRQGCALGEVLTISEIAFLDGTVFASVSASEIGTAMFTTALIGQPFDPDDTIILHTCEDNFFKIGNAICNTGNATNYPDCQDANTPLNTVTFDFQRLQ